MTITSNKDSQATHNFAKSLARDYFQHLNKELLLFVSEKHEEIIIDQQSRESAPACFIPQKEYLVTCAESQEFNELIKFQKFPIDTIWISKDLDHQLKFNWRKVICHELKHFEQMASNSRLFDANQLFECIFHDPSSPCNIDANNFADSIVDGNHHPYYSWESEVTRLIRDNFEKIRKIKHEINQSPIVNSYTKYVLNKFTDQELKTI